MVRIIIRHYFWRKLIYFISIIEKYYKGKFTEKLFLITYVLILKILCYWISFKNYYGSLNSWPLKSALKALDQFNKTQVPWWILSYPTEWVWLIFTFNSNIAKYFVDKTFLSGNYVQYWTIICPIWADQNVFDPHNS